MIEDCAEISECEKKLSLNITTDRLIGEITLSNDDINKLSVLINEIISYDIRKGIQILETKFPTCTACFLVWKGILDYRDGDYWSSIKNSIGISDPNIQTRIGQMFIEFLKLNSLLYFEVKDAHKNITPILAHGMIPNYCLHEYFENVLFPFFEEMTYPDDENEIKFWLKNQREKNNEITNIEEEVESLKINEFSQKKIFYESLVSSWDELDKIKELELNIPDINQLNSLLQAFSDYETKKQIKMNIQQKILELEEKIRELEGKKIIIISPEYNIIFEHLDDINNCIVILSELEIGYNELKELNALRDSLDEKIVNEAKVILSEPWNNIYVKFLEQVPFNELKKKVEAFNAVKTKYSEKEKTPLNRFFKSVLNYVFYIFKINEIKQEKFHLNEIKEMLCSLPIDEKHFIKPDELIRNLELFKKNIEEFSILDSKINTLETINTERIKAIKNVAVTLEIDVNKNIEQIVLIMQNQLAQAKMHEKSAIISEKTIKDIELDLNELKNEKLSIEDEIQEIENRFAVQGNGDIQTGIERVKQFHESLNIASSIRDALTKTYPEFDALKQEKILADLNGRDKNHYIVELEKKTEELHQIKLKENELNKKKNEISNPFRYVDKPTRRFLLYGNKFADNFVIESVRMVKLAREGKSSILLTEIKLPERIVDKFVEWWEQKQIPLFRWDEVPGRDSERFKSFLIKNFFGLDWIIYAEIEKVNENTIKVSKDSQSLLLKLNSEKTKVILTLDDKVFDEFIAKIEDGRIRIYESKPVIYYDEGDGEIKVRVPPQQIDYCCKGASILMNSNRQDQRQEYPRIYKSSNNNFITEEINFSVDLPSEIYEFQLITEKETKILNSVLGISHTHPFLVFDYKSKRLIQKNEKHEIPGCDVWLVSKETSNFEPEIHIKEDRKLVGNWSGYIARAIELKNIEQLFLCYNGNKYKIPIKENQFSKPQIYGNKLESATSDGKDIFIDEAPIISIPFSSDNEINKYSIHIFPIISELKESKHFLLDDLAETLRFDGDLCEICLSNEKCIGNALGEFKVRVKNEAHNVDLNFEFCVIPWMKLTFDKYIYLPHKEQNQPVYLDIDFSRGLQFEPVKPAVITNRDTNKLFIKSSASEPYINEVMKYKSLSIPITIPIPRLTWHLEGIKSKKYLFETNEIGGLSEEEWEDAVNDKLMLIVNVPLFVNGMAHLNLHNSIGQKSKEKINDGRAIFDMRIFTDTLRKSTQSTQPFELTFMDSKSPIKDVLLFKVKKWQIEPEKIIEKIYDHTKERGKGIKEKEWQVVSIECKRIRDGLYQFLEIKWKEVGYASDKILSLWQLNGKKRLIHTEKLQSSSNIAYIKIDEKITSYRNYLIIISSNDAKESNIQKRIYLLKDWSFLKHIKNLIEMQHKMIKRFESRGDEVINLKNINNELTIISNYYVKLGEFEKLPHMDPKPYVKVLLKEFENQVKITLNELGDDEYIRRILGEKIYKI